MGDGATRLAEIVGQRNLLVGDAISEAYTHDEALTATPQKPAYVAKPATPDEVAELLRFATEHGVPVTARGSGCGVSGAAQPVDLDLSRVWQGWPPVDGAKILIMGSVR